MKPRLKTAARVAWIAVLIILGAVFFFAGLLFRELGGSLINLANALAGYTKRFRDPITDPLPRFRGHHHF